MYNFFFLFCRLRRSGQPEAFLLVSNLYVALRSLQFERLWLELFFLRRRILYLSPGRPAPGAHHDPSGDWRIPFYEQHAHECLLRHHDRDWNDRPIEEESNQHYESVGRGAHRTHRRVRHWRAVDMAFTNRPRL